VCVLACLLAALPLSVSLSLFLRPGIHAVSIISTDSTDVFPLHPEQNDT